VVGGFGKGEHGGALRLVEPTNVAGQSDESGCLERAADPLIAAFGGGTTIFEGDMSLNLDRGSDLAIYADDAVQLFVFRAVHCVTFCEIA
jgi:hypothetical protein